MKLPRISARSCCPTANTAHWLHPWAGKVAVTSLVSERTLLLKIFKELLSRLRVVIQTCRENGIKLSINKFEIGQRVKFAGFIVSSQGMMPDPGKLASIRDFPTPKSVTDLRSFLGLANQLGAFIPDLQHATVKMRELLKKSSAWLWLQDHEDEFCKAKNLLTSPAIVQPFDPSLKTQLLTDASKLHGLGFALIQREQSLDGKGKIRLVQCGSCALSVAQKNYATIELEMSAIWFAVQKCSYYLRGMPQFEVITDHRPLLGIFEKPLASLNNTRLQRLRENLDQFSFNITWTAGKNHLVADALSRFPVFAANPELDVALCAAVCSSDPAYKVITSRIDAEYIELRDCIQHGRPLSHRLSPFGEIIDKIRVGDKNEEGLLLVGNRIVVPRPARRDIIELLHLSHAGMTKSTELARQLYYWPYEPILPDIAKSPMESVSVDLFDLNGKSFLVMVDRYSGFPFVASMQSTTTGAVIDRLVKWFNEVGFPRRLKSDNGPQFRQRFAEFCDEVGIEFETSSPYNPRSNGLAESAVKSVKSLLTKLGGTDGKTFRSALLEWRATPRPDGFSPSVGFYGRHIRTRLPAARSMKMIGVEGLVAFERARLKAGEKHTRAAAGCPLPVLNLGDRVHVQHLC